MYECASYCLEEGKQSEQRTKNRVEKGLETNKQRRNLENKVQKCMLNRSIVFFWLKTLDQSMQVRAVLLPSTDNSGPQVPWYSHQRLPAHDYT